MASMAFSSREHSVENAFQATDFRDFIESLLKACSTGKRVAEEVASYVLLNLESPTMQLPSWQEYVGIVQKLLAERRELDAHYGWILASDAQLVYKSMGGTNNDGAIWARRWMKSIFEEYEQVGRALADVWLRLRL